MRGRELLPRCLEAQLLRPQGPKFVPELCLQAPRQQGWRKRKPKERQNWNGRVNRITKCAGMVVHVQAENAHLRRLSIPRWRLEVQHGTPVERPRNRCASAGWQLPYCRRRCRGRCTSDPATNEAPRVPPKCCMRPPGLTGTSRTVARARSPIVRRRNPQRLALGRAAC